MAGIPELELATLAEVEVDAEVDVDVTPDEVASALDAFEPDEALVVPPVPEAV